MLLGLGLLLGLLGLGFGLKRFVWECPSRYTASTTTFLVKRRQAPLLNTVDYGMAAVFYGALILLNNRHRARRMMRPRPAKRAVTNIELAV